MKINLTDKYKTRSGHPVTVYAVDLRNGEYPVLAVIHHPDCDYVNFYKDNGKMNETDNERDLIKVSPYDHIKIDDKVLVWNDGGGKLKRYFYGVNEDGRPMTTVSGFTSWIASNRESWDNCEKVDE